MKSTYDSSLKLLKSTFSGSEGNIWVDEVKNKLPVSHLRLLDIGVGTGESIHKKITQLVRAGYTIELHGLDPNLSVDTVRQNVSCATVLYTQSFEDYVSETSFDIVNATQSFYYLSDIENTLKKMSAFTKENGLFISTLWSETCILYKLHTALFGKKDEDITAEKVYSALAHMPGLKHVKVVRATGFIDIDKWKYCTEIRDAAMDIVSRRFDDVPLTCAQRQCFMEVLDQYHGNVPRINFMLIAQK